MRACKFENALNFVPNGEKTNDLEKTLKHQKVPSLW